MIDVYYGNSNEKFYGLLDIEPISVVKDIQQYEGIQNYIKCPAATSYFHNMFVVKCPVDVSYDYIDDNNFGPKHAPEDAKNIMTFSFSDGMHLIQINLVEYLFMSQAPLTITSLPPFMHNSVVNNFAVLPGEFDISQWYRPIHLSFYTETKILPFDIRRGEALFYIKFNTNEKISLKKYKVTQDLWHYAMNCVNLKHHLRKKNFNFLYNLFSKNSYNRRIVKEIKDNLI